MENKNRIRQVRNSLNMTGPDVASKLGISTTYLYDIEKGKRGLSSEIVSELASIFKTTTDYLLGKTDINLYDWIPYEEETVDLDAKTPPLFEESEIPIEELANHSLTYKGKELTDAQKQHLVKLLQAAADMLEK